MQECVENCDYQKIKDKSCILNYKDSNKEDNEKIYDDFLKYAEDEFTSYNYNTSNLENGNDDIYNCIRSNDNYIYHNRKSKRRRKKY